MRHKLTCTEVLKSLSPVISKLFESVLLGVYEDYSDSDNLQFGFF